MLCKRIIACLDVKDGRTVKGVHFNNLKDVGDPVQLTKYYCEQGADELVFLDISASQDKRSTMLEWVKLIAKVIDIPFSVGGGIDSEATAEAILTAGADKLCLNTSVLNNPFLISHIAQRMGSQSVVVAIDARKESDGNWIVYSHGGKQKTSKNLFDWAKEAESLGAGEILFTSMNHDGTGEGYALDALSLLSKLVGIPVIASGGAGKMTHFKDLFLLTQVDAALAAGIFHRNEILLPELKNYLIEHKIPIRPYIHPISS